MKTNEQTSLFWTTLISLLLLTDVITFLLSVCIWMYVDEAAPGVPLIYLLLGCLYITFIVLNWFVFSQYKEFQQSIKPIPTNTSVWFSGGLLRKQRRVAKNSK